MSIRTEQVKSLLKTEISDIIRRQVNDPRIGFVTITDAEVTSDLHYAKVYVSVLGSDEEKKKTFDALQSASRFIRNEFGNRVKMKTIPEITFVPDHAIDHGARMFELLERIKKEEDGPERD